MGLWRGNVVDSLPNVLGLWFVGRSVRAYVWHAWCLTGRAPVSCPSLKPGRGTPGSNGHQPSAHPFTMRFSLLTTLALAASARAAVMFVGSYGGQIFTVNLNDITGALTLLGSTSASAPRPSWQETSPVAKDILYSVEEWASSNSSVGAVTSYRVAPDGSLTKLFSATQMRGPVSMAVSPNGKMIFTAS